MVEKQLQEAKRKEKDNIVASANSRYDSQIESKQAEIKKEENAFGLNDEEKIAEYANEPSEDYMDPEEQLIGLSGGLNRPKKSYPASAPGDNPMDQEPREVEETMEAVEEKLYKSYKIC